MSLHRFSASLVAFYATNELTNLCNHIILLVILYNLLANLTNVLVLPMITIVSINILRAIFCQTRDAVLSDLANHNASTRLRSVRFENFSASALAQEKSGEYYRVKKFIPGYYDANDHIVYLNYSVLAKLDVPQIKLIAYHELVHAASWHFVDKLNRRSRFHSGFRIEEFISGQRVASNQSFNEGVTQMLAVEGTGYSAAAYKEEVDLAREVVTAIGRQTILNVICDGDLNSFNVVFADNYGPDCFARFSSALDRKQYHRAAAILQESQNKTINVSTQSDLGYSTYSQPAYAF